MHGRQTRSVATSVNCAASNPLGVTATNDVDALLALEPDCVVYNPMFADVDEMVRILRAGINMVSTSEFITGHFLGEGRDRITEACESGGSTIFGSGINPGFIQLFAIVSAGLSERVDKVSVVEAIRHHHLQLAGHRETRWDSAIPSTSLISRRSPRKVPASSAMACCWSPMLSDRTRRCALRRRVCPDH